jgi:glycosyltransferase involved in cell wall biosynthesis
MSASFTFSKLRNYYQGHAASLVYKRPFSVQPPRPLISFTFDDFPRSALLTGGAILQHFGRVGTYYVSLGLAGTDTASGHQFHLDDLATLFEQGHELGCHTFSHCDSWDTKSRAFEDSIVENRAALDNLFPGAEFESFAYPITLPRPLSKARIASYFLSCRAGGQKMNRGRTDLNQLSAYFLERSGYNLQAVTRLIDANSEACGWLIFATHDISDNHTRFGCSPSFFEGVVRYAVNSGAQILPVVKALEVLGAPGCDPTRAKRTSVGRERVAIVRKMVRQPLVSILIPAYNAQEWIAGTLQSAIAQTWSRKEIIVVDDGSKDQTLTVARQFESQGVRVVAEKNQGASAARNTLFSLCQGDYIQWLDADDFLAPDKLAKQMAVVGDVTKSTLLSSEFGRFLYRWQRAQFVRTGLWEDLSPTEWLRRKMGRNLYMQTATWLVSRQLSEAAGPWDPRMLSDDDGEYFCRVLLKSDGTRFVPGSKVYYRGGFRSGSLAYIGRSNRKLEALWLSMQLHISYLKSLEDSPRIHDACLTYLQTNLINFYPERADIVDQARRCAKDLGGDLRPPELSWKYSWIEAAFGWRTAKDLALRARTVRWSLTKSLDKTMFYLRNRRGRLAIPSRAKPELE